MKTSTLIRVATVAMLLTIAVAFGYARSAECAYCPNYPCYGTCATPDCVCMTAPGETAGTCWGVGYSTTFKAMGFSVGD